MKDYYEILDVPKSASSLKIFKEFRKRYLQSNLDHLKAEEVLTAYLVLQESSRKFYDIARKQEQKGKLINPKYLSVIEYKEKKAKELLDKQKNNPKILTKPLKKYPIGDSGLEFIGLLMEVNLGWVATGIFLTIAAILTTGICLINGDWMILLITLPLMTIGIFMHNHGIMKFKKEKIEKITTHNIGAKAPPPPDS